MYNSLNKTPNIVDFIESIWTIPDISNCKKYHIDLDDSKKLILNMMVSELYFIGELERQFGKSEMCLMYAVYMAMKNTNNRISILHHNEMTSIDMKKYLDNILKNLMIVNCFREKSLEFNTGSIIDFNEIHNDGRETTHVVIDDAAFFSENTLREVFEMIPKNADIKILSSPNNNVIYDELIKNKRYTYLRYCSEED